MRRGSSVLGLMMVFSLAVGCSDGDTNGAAPDGGGVDTQIGSASASLKGVKAYDAVTGTAQLEVDVTGAPSKVELMAGATVLASADSAPYTLSWDTTADKDGIVELKLRCNGDDTMTSEVVPVVVLNKGSEASFTDGTGGAIDVPADGAYIDQHLKYHWAMPKGVTRVIGVLHWDELAMELELAIGVGECPDSGTKAADAQGKSGAVAVEFGNGQPLSEGQWFAHVDLKNRTDAAVKGKKAPFTVKAYLLVD